MSQHNNAAENKYLWKSLLYYFLLLFGIIMYSIIALYSPDHIKQLNWSA